MAGNYLIDPNSFTGMVLMGSMPREKFGEPGTQERTSDGNVPKWTVEVAVSFPPAQGRKVPSEVIAVTVPGHTDPADGLAVGTPVQLVSLRLGVSTAQLKGDRVQGGKAWFIADQVTSVAATSYRSKSQDAA